MNTLVWEHLGCPARAALVPGPRTTAWHEARTRLEHACRHEGRPCRIRTPGVLWSLFQTGRPGGGVPQRTTWDRMWGETTLGTLLGRSETQSTGQGLRLATWNVRWLVSPHTHQGYMKRQRIMRGLGAGRVVALQETHWQGDSAAVWHGLFPGVEVLSTHTCSSARGGPCGGVAILVPGRYCVVNSEVIVPGYCMEAQLRLRDPFCG